MSWPDWTRLWMIDRDTWGRCRRLRELNASTVSPLVDYDGKPTGDFIQLVDNEPWVVIHGADLIESGPDGIDVDLRSTRLTAEAIRSIVRETIKAVKEEG